MKPYYSKSLWQSALQQYSISALPLLIRFGLIEVMYFDRFFKIPKNENEKDLTKKMMKLFNEYVQFKIYFLKAIDFLQKNFKSHRTPQTPKFHTESRIVKISKIKVSFLIFIK